MTNIIKTINTYIKSNIEGVTLYNDLFPKPESLGVVSIHDPAARIVEEYIDGSADYQLNVSFTARYSNAKTCRETLTNILELLDGARIQDTDDDFLLKINTVANVQFVGIDDKNNSIYSASINVAYTKA